MSNEEMNFDDFEIQSFETTVEGARLPRGTVIGQSDVPIAETGEMDPNCNPTYTQGSSCAGSASCDGGCGTGATCGGGCGDTDTVYTYGSSSVCSNCATAQCTQDCGGTQNNGSCTGHTCADAMGCQGVTSSSQGCATSAGWTGCNGCG